MVDLVRAEKNVADDFNLVFAKVAVYMRIADKGVCCLRKLSFGGNAQALTLNAELRRFICELFRSKSIAFPPNKCY